MLSAESCFTIKASEPAPMLGCRNLSRSKLASRPRKDPKENRVDPQQDGREYIPAKPKLLSLGAHCVTILALVSSAGGFCTDRLRR